MSGGLLSEHLNAMYLSLIACMPWYADFPGQGCIWWSKYCAASIESVSLTTSSTTCTSWSCDWLRSGRPSLRGQMRMSSEWFVGWWTLYQLRRRERRVLWLELSIYTGMHGGVLLKISGLEKPLWANLAVKNVFVSESLIVLLTSVGHQGEWLVE